MKMPYEVIIIREQINDLRSICEEAIDNCKRLEKENKALKTEIKTLKAQLNVACSVM